jgi:hypothetical protein
MRTGENEMGLKKIMDMTRMISIVILLLHFYVACYSVFQANGWTHPIGDRILDNIGRAGLFASFHRAKWISLGLLTLSLLGTKGRKGETFKCRTAIAYIFTGLLLYFISILCLKLDVTDNLKTGFYIGVTSLGFILFMTGGSLLTRIIKLNLKGDVFNTQNETFPQEERLIENRYSVHFKTQYRLRDKLRQGWVNRINGFRGTLIMGLSGSGKTRYVVKEIIRQEIRNGYAMFIHDFKYPDLTNVAYYHFLENKRKYKAKPDFYVLNFEDIKHRCNPLMPGSIRNLTDAASASGSIIA